MNDRTFAEIIAENFEEIRRNFKTGSINKGYPWDEDILNDAFISCNSALKDKCLSKTDALKYFWTSYVNKIKTKLSKQDYTISLDDCDVDEIEDTHNYDVDRIYDIIIESIQDKFGLRKAYIWDLYVCRGMSAKKIRNMGFNDVDNFIYFNRQIKRYIKNHVIPKNVELQELIKNRFEN